MKIHIRLFILFAILTSTAFFFQSCDELTEDISTVKVKVPIERQTFTVDSALFAQKTNEVILAQFAVDINLDSIIEANGVDFLDQGTFSELVIGVLDPEDVDLSFLEAAKVTVSSTESFEEEYIVATVTDIDEEQNSANLIINDLSVTDQLRQHVFYIRVYGQPGEPLPVNVVTMYVDGVVCLTIDLF